MPGKPEKESSRQDAASRPGKKSGPDPSGDFPGFFDQTTEYLRDPATGRWIVKNPAGSSAYNYLYHDRSRK